MPHTPAATPDGAAPWGRNPSSPPCDAAPHSPHARRPQELERYVFADVAAHSPVTVQSMFASCSHGRAVLSRQAGSAVVGPVPMPCAYTNATSRAAYE